MTQPANASTRVHFGIFELDLTTGELRRKGVKVALQEQPFQVLAMLVEEQKLMGLVFFDAGQGFDDSKGWAFNGIRTSAGFGIRWFSPLGPIRLELGFNLAPKRVRSGASLTS